MGFDNECILNIQSLAGEYFCPVCRLLVYPNEALQSQCTHLYCKPCLTYVVSTTRACPYDGYLVTEADSKPLIESNKALAETIGKITVHCLYHRSGCPWQGPLSECTSHCSGCAFGNSPVVCNRCGIQIVHRQVQEHAQNCPGVQPQAQHAEGAQDATATGTAATGDQTQAATQAGTATTQAQTLTTSSMPGQNPNQLASSTSQAQSVVQAAVPTAEQWYQQQQQYQQYYQQYPGYDPYQQHYQQYYPYQQQAVPQYQQPQVNVHPQVPQPQLQPQIQVQPQTQLQSQPLSQPQPHPPIQLPVGGQPTNQAQVNLQPTQPMVQPQSQTQSLTPPPPHGHQQPHPIQPHPQHVQMPQYQLPHLQTQHPQLQMQVQAHSQLQTQHHPVPQPHSQAQPQTHVPHHPQPLPQSLASQPNQPVNPNLQPQAQHPSANAVTGHHSYTQPQTHQHLGAPQLPGHTHPQGGAQLQSQHPVHMQSQFSQQAPLLRPPQSHAMVQNLQQPGLLPSPGQVPNVPPAQQPPVHSQAYQPGLPVHQRPVTQPLQQPMHQQYVQPQQPFPGQPWGPVQNQVHQQGSYAQQQLPGQTQLRPQGPPQSFQQPSHAYPQPQQNVALPHGMQPHQAQSPAAKSMVPLHGVLPQSYPQSSVGMQARPTFMQVGGNQQSGNVPRANNQVQMSSEQLSGVTSRSMSERQGDYIIEKGADAELSSQKKTKKDVHELDMAFALGADASEIKAIKSESDLKPVDDENKPIGETKDMPESLAAEHGRPLIKQVKEEPAEGTDDLKYASNVHNKQEELSVSDDNEIKDGPLLKAPSMQEAEHLEERSMISQKDKNMTPQGSGCFPPHGQVQGGGSVQPSHSVPVIDQGKHPPPIHYGPSALQQRPVGPSLQEPQPGPPHHTQLPGNPPTHSRPLGPGHMPYPGQPLNPPPEHLQQSVYKQPYGPEISPGGVMGPGSTSVFGRGPSHYGTPQGPYAQGHAPPSQGERTQSYGPEAEVFLHQRPNYTDGRQLDPLGQHSGMHSNAMRMNGASGLDSSSMRGLQDDRFRPFQDERLNPFQQDPARHIIDRGQFEDPKHFPRPSHLDTEHVPKFGRGPHGFGMDAAPRPLDKGSHGLMYNSGLNMEPLGGSDPSRFFPLHHHDGTLHPNDVGERPIGPGSGYGHRHMDDFGPRSPGRDYPGMSSRGFGAVPGLDDMDSRESRRFVEPVSSFHDSRFPVLPGHLRRGEFEGNLQLGDHMRSGDLIGQDGRPNHLRRGEHLGSRNLPSHLRLGESAGFGAFPGHGRMGELAGPGNFYHPRLGEPGFRSSLPLKGFPNDGGSYAGELDSFDNLGKRKPSSMGWCRICKVDCETVEGLDLHSQTREHQTVAMDMVVTIKQNAKKQKLAPSDHSSLDASKSRNASFEGRGNKH